MRSLDLDRQTTSSLLESGQCVVTLVSHAVHQELCRACQVVIMTSVSKLISLFRDW